MFINEKTFPKNKMKILIKIKLIKLYVYKLINKKFTYNFSTLHSVKIR
jgi:hypothetical protein